MERNDSPEPDAARFRILAYATRKAAEQAYDEFIMLGVRPEDISLFVQAEKPNDGDAALDHDIDVGGAVGASASAVAGGVGGLPRGFGIADRPWPWAFARRWARRCGSHGRGHGRCLGRLGRLAYGSGRRPGIGARGRAPPRGRGAPSSPYLRPLGMTASPKRPVVRLC